MIDLVGEIERETELRMQEFVYDEVLVTAKENAPVLSGNLQQHIQAIQMGKFLWKITTNSFGDNGFPYPAHIEEGEGVKATKAKVLRFRIHGRTIRTRETAPSTKAHFMENTVNAFK